MLLNYLCNVYALTLSQDVMILDHSVFSGMADIHDRHRDMRLDVDNMSYEVGKYDIWLPLCVICTLFNPPNIEVSDSFYNDFF